MIDRKLRRYYNIAEEKFQGSTWTIKKAEGRSDMKSFMDMSQDELLTLKAALEEQLRTEEAKGLSLNMARGKPGCGQACDFHADVRRD